MTLPTIKKECQQFLRESEGLPLLKLLPINKDGFIKVKVRFKNKNNVFTEAFNRSFENKNIANSSIFSNSKYISNENSLEEFYIFPINGYKFAYNPVITDSVSQYNSLLENSLKIMKKESTIDMFSSVIKNSYITEKFAEGIKIGAEIIIWNIPYYYAIRKNLIDSYSQLI